MALQFFPVTEVELPVNGQALGAPYHDFPEDLTTFAERKAYQLGVAHARAVDRVKENSRRYLALRTLATGLPEGLDDQVLDAVDKAHPELALYSGGEGTRQRFDDAADAIADELEARGVL